MEVLYNSEFHWNSESLTFNISMSFFISIIATKATKSTLLSKISMTIFINPFAPEPPLTACADPGPFYPLWRHQF